MLISIKNCHDSRICFSPLATFLQLLHQTFNLLFFIKFHKKQFLEYLQNVKKTDNILRGKTVTSLTIDTHHSIKQLHNRFDGQKKF